MRSLADMAAAAGLCRLYQIDFTALQVYLSESSETPRQQRSVAAVVPAELPNGWPIAPTHPMKCLK